MGFDFDKFENKAGGACAGLARRRHTADSGECCGTAVHLCGGSVHVSRNLCERESARRVRAGAARVSEQRG